MSRPKATLACSFLVFALFAVAGCGGHAYTPAQDTAQTSAVPSADPGDPGEVSTLSTKTKSVKACSDIAQPGTYALTTSLTVPSGQACFTIHDTSKVTLDCKNHTITASAPAIEFTNVNGYTVKNCNLQPNGNGYILEIVSSSNGTITNDTVGHSSSSPQSLSTAVNVAHSTKLTVTSNTLYIPLQVQYSTGTVVSTNTFSCSLSICGSLIAFQSGSSNAAVSNKIDGKAGVDAPIHSPGSDDGVLLFDETSDLVQSNTIQNLWDCGLETYGEVASATISKNTITNASTCGIGGWYYLSLSNSTIANNTVNGSGDLFTFWRIYGLRPAGWNGPNSPAETGVYFTNNTFTSNTFTNSYQSTGVESTYIPFVSGGSYLAYDGGINSGDVGEVAPTQSQFHLANNTFTKNTFGPPNKNIAFLGDTLVPGAVIDGGGNICGKTAYPNYPLACGRP
jgi:hypothetical protein